MGVGHAYQSATANDGSKEISSTRWNEDHVTSGRTVTGAFSVAASDNMGFIYVNSASGVTGTLPNNLDANFSTTVVQLGAGAVTFSATASGTLTNRQTHTKTAGAGAMVGLVVVSNSGTNAAWYLGGDTAA